MESSLSKQTAFLERISTSILMTDKNELDIYFNRIEVDIHKKFYLI